MSRNSDCSFYCFICNKIITSEEVKYLHFEQHVNYNRFKCLECGSQYSTFDDLKYHQQCLKHFDFQKTTNIGVRKLITSLMELSSKIVPSADMDSIKFLLTIETEKNKTGNPESGISNDNEEKTIDNDRAGDKPLISNINTEIVNSITVEIDNEPKKENSSDSGRNWASNNILRVENLGSPIKMKRSEYLCTKMLEIKRFRINNKIINKCLQCHRVFISGRRKIMHVFKDHIMLNEFEVLECMYCLNEKGESRKFLDVSSIQDHYKEVHKFPNSGCPNNLACNYNGKEKYIHVNGSIDLLAQYETQFVKCFIKSKKVGRRRRY